jgi:hypothetical protein
MLKFLNKGVSTTLALGIVLVLAIVAGLFAIKQSQNIEEGPSTTVEMTKKENPYIKLTYPKGGERFTVGDTIDITWESSGIDNIDIAYKREGSGAEVNGWIAKDVPASQNSFAWLTTKDIFPGPEYQGALLEILVHESPFPAGTSQPAESSGWFAVNR